ncbi:P-loop containing nucleoside triphosphate hydrolase protein [Calycina marina]|uniref:ATP-dependent RNA helicase n=1 Tax=Calycina marina TaxID=1763456 RepID=A0A9P7ZCK1_9HELO|nr:P-loop containing nucleoside triphosphate hydrolase protein [Calycina marina]
MDILKLLSRSRKKDNKVSSGTGNNLPSAGTSENPQLFHDPIPASRGQKRKRNAGETEKNETTSEVLDFFAPPATKVKIKNTIEPASALQLPKNTQDVATLLEDEECRQILRSHRLKATLLTSSKLPEKKIKKSNKSKKDKPKKSKLGNVRNKELHPQPLTAFNTLRTTYGISKRLGENLAAQGYKLPTEVQMGSLPLLLQSETALSKSPEELSVSSSKIDLLAVAPTGSGKTLAFLIPVINSIIQRRRTSTEKGLHELEAVVVAPTKELAAQIVNEAKKLSLGTGVKVVEMRKCMRVLATNTEEIHAEDCEEESGGEDEQSRLTGANKASEQSSVKTNILVATPGLLLSAISKGKLATVRTLVLDEADVLLDELFRDQTCGIWESCINPDLRVTLWSATMGSNIETLAASIIESRWNKLGLEPSSLVRLIVGLKDSAIPNITHRLVYAATEPGKLLALRQLLHPTSSSEEASQSLRPPFLVFTQTIPRAKALFSELLYDIPAEAGGSTRIAVLHSELSDPARALIMTRFRNGEIWILITTDILSRGVDFRGINGVVNYDVPNSGAAYIHRVGRTGRAGRSGGVAVTFYTKDDIPYIKSIAQIIAASEKQAGKPASESSMQKWLLDSLPTPSKEVKKKLKKYGVEARRGGLGEAKEGVEAKKGKGRMQISSKSGYERKLENNRKGAIKGSQRRAQLAEGDSGGDGEDGVTAEEGEFEGLDD